MKSLTKNLTKQTTVWGFKSEKPAEWYVMKNDEKNKWMYENHVIVVKNSHLTMLKILKLAKELNIVWTIYVSHNAEFVIESIEPEK